MKNNIYFYLKILCFFIFTFKFHKPINKTQNLNKLDKKYRGKNQFMSNMRINYNYFL